MPDASAPVRPACAERRPITCAAHAATMQTKFPKNTMAAAFIATLAMAMATPPLDALATGPLDCGYAQRSLERVAAIDGVDLLAVERLVAETSRVASLADGAEKARALEAVTGAIGRLGEASRPSLSRSDAVELTFEEAPPADPGMVASSVSWVLDRPVPWERDCSCCYPVCPADRWCIKQADKRYLACAGFSVRQRLKFAFLDRCAGSGASGHARAALPFARHGASRPPPHPRREQANGFVRVHRGNHLPCGQVALLLRWCEREPRAPAGSARQAREGDNTAVGACGQRAEGQLDVS